MIRFGVAGFPKAFWGSDYKKNRMNIFDWLTDLNIDAFEAQMTYGPRTTDENCFLMKRLAEERNIKLSVHAAYYIVLTSNEKAKINRSIDTLKRTFDKAHKMGANTVVLHPGPLYKKEPKVILEQLSENLNSFWNDIGKSDIGLFLETAGKKGQLGSVEDVLELSRRFKGCHPCIDFGHVHAREGGSLETKQNIAELIKSLEHEKLFEQNKRVHFHYTPIEYGQKGEIQHRALPDKKINEKNKKLELYHPRFEPIIDNFMNKDVDFTIISETHNSQEIGAMEMKKYFNKLINKQKINT